MDAHPERSRVLRVFLILILTTPLHFVACTGDTASGVAPQESDVLASLYRDGVQPSLARLGDATQQLNRSVAALCGRPTTGALDKARDSWRDAYLAWNAAKPFLFGPAVDMGLVKRLDDLPVHTQVLDAVVVKEDLGHLREESTVRGFGALEHLLYSAQDAQQATAGLRCRHLQDVSNEIATQCEQLQAAWAQEFAQQFLAAGDGKPFLIPGDALSLAFARLLNVTEVMLRDRIGIPSGFFKESTRPDYLAAWRSGQTVQMIEATLRGLRTALVADGASGFTRLVATKDGLVEKKNPQLAADIVDQLDEINDTLMDLREGHVDLHASVADKATTLKSLYKKVHALQAQLIEASLVLELDVRTPIEGMIVQ